MNSQDLDLEAIRSRLAATHGRHFWRSLDELAETKEFTDFVHREFPQHASEWLDPLTRRTFLKLMSASIALAGLTACGAQPPEKIVPYVKQPEEILPGKPLFYATAFALGGYATGVLVRSDMGRPTKIEGNPQHPASLGATDPIAQGSILNLYDPDRSQSVLNLGRPSTWEAFTSDLNRALATQTVKRGAGLRILSETITSPTLAAQIGDLLKRYPAAKWHQYEPTWRDGAFGGGRMAFGQDVNTIYRFEQADVVFSLDGDFLMSLPGSMRYARKFIDKRRVGAGQTAMNRLYVVESTPTLTGAMADHRLHIRASEIESVARAAAQGLGVAGVTGAALPSDVPAKWIAAMVKDLKANAGRSIVVPGEEQPAIVHALAHAINASLGNTGKTVIYTDPVAANPVDQTASLRDLVQAMNGGQVDMLVVLGANPVYTAPADLKFTEAFNKVSVRVHLGLYQDETAALSHWHIPEAHYLEAWGDARAFDGTASIVQPLIAPLYAGRSAHELISALAGDATRSGYDIVRAFWQTKSTAADFESAWRRALHDGVIDGTTLPPRQVTLSSSFAAPASAAPAAGSLEIIFRPDPNIGDGRFANNGWLQELPKPLTTLTWDNAAFVSPTTAQRLGLQNEDLIDLSYGGQTVPAPVWILPGHPNDAVTVHLGYGRTHAGRVGQNTGFNAYALRTSGAPWFGSGLQLRKTGKTYELAATQTHFSMEGRELVRVATISEFQHAPKMNPDDWSKPPNGDTLYPEYKYDGYKWGMAIDLNACIGCNACTIACRAENNIPVVGKVEVRRSREMDWIRVDRYYEGSELDNPDVYFQPRPCMHCEKAPCEVVCPVAATTHSAEGLNQMTYNRCVGTRYCSNNCPYKVRRFNFLQYADKDTPVIQLMYNPDVTVRDRGVMEKCSYCVQRINSARIEAERENRSIVDGEVRTACQQVCPTSAIIFGDINDPKSAVRRLKSEPLHYGMLSELGTQPRTTYGPRLRNPNPEIEQI